VWRRVDRFRLLEEIEDLIGEVRWLALFRVHTPKAFSHATMFKQMRNAWHLLKMSVSKQWRPICFEFRFSAWEIGIE
jgi:hypothetical protein